VLELISGLFWKFIFLWKHRIGYLDLGKDLDITGVVASIEYNPEDEDLTFNLQPDAEWSLVTTSFGGRKTTEDPKYPDTIHCEVAPWKRNVFVGGDYTWGRMNLTPGTRVRVKGRWGYDGVHTNKGLLIDVWLALRGHGPNPDYGWCEIHPVTLIEFLEKGDKSTGGINDRKDIKIR
jgi:hypothetical protein